MPAHAPRTNPTIVQIVNRDWKVSSGVLYNWLILMWLPFVLLIMSANGMLLPFLYSYTEHRPIVVQPSDNARGVRVVAMSDTHGHHDRIRVPDGDVLVHCGDFTDFGTYGEMVAFVEWFAAFDHPHKVVVPGNHDILMDKEYHARHWREWSKRRESHQRAVSLFAERGVHLLINESVIFNGIHVHGVPFVTSHSSHWSMAFERDDTPELWSSIPEHTDILLTHQPPYGRLDRDLLGYHEGSPHLLREVQRKQPRLHIFGHAHVEHGYQTCQTTGTTYINAAVTTPTHHTKQVVCVQV